MKQGEKCPNCNKVPYFLVKMGKKLLCGLCHKSVPKSKKVNWLRTTHNKDYEESDK